VRRELVAEMIPQVYPLFAADLNMGRLRAFFVDL
jgi:hypothetical protein